LDEQENFPRCGTTRRQVILGAAAVLGGITAYPWSARGEDGLGLSHGTEAIRQEPAFRASRKRVYEALTDSQQFDKVMRLSAAMRSMATGTKPAEISRDAGGVFSIFGGYVSGRHIELVPNQRIVQAWRPQSWKPGDYSIVKFELVEQGAGTKILFEHRGFPDGTGEQLAVGWRENYWEPLQRYLDMHQ
jgi:activator of HSP90 ATPase